MSAIRLTRREFLGSTTLLAAGYSLPGFLARTAALAAQRDRSGGPILVVVQMSGGNDGLNTVVPYRDDLYFRARPTLAQPAERVHRLTGELGLHPDMAALKRLFDDGWLSVIGNVGYPNPDRSHFRAMDIWHTASTLPESLRTGWLGRAVDRHSREGEAPLAIHLDDEPLPLALIAEQGDVPSIRDIDAFRLRWPAAHFGGRNARPSEEPAESLQRAILAPRVGASEDLLFVQRTAVSSCANARRLEGVDRGEGGSLAYPSHRLAAKLRQIAQLISADFGASIYYTSIGGFDTHAKQALAHGPLLRELAESIAAFLDDLKARGLAERVLLMTFSEFGRRLAENGSQGTDHGAAAPMFVAGPGCVPGLLGAPPNLADLDDGDVAFQTDFRRVYAGLLADWLHMDPAPILGQRFEPVRLVRS